MTSPGSLVVKTCASTAGAQSSVPGQTKIPHVKLQQPEEKINICLRTRELREYVQAALTSNPCSNYTHHVTMKVT